MAGKKITQLISGSLSNLTLDSVLPLVYSGTTFQHDLNDLRQVLVDSGSHHFTGSQNIDGNLTVLGTGSVSDYLSVGKNVPPHVDGPESLRVENSGSINVARFYGDQQNYIQINLKNRNSGSNASADLVVTADNGTEGVHFVDLGINSSTYNAGYVGYENDAYLLNVGKDLYVGTVGGIEHPSKLHLFANNNWENPQMTVHTGSQITFNTLEIDNGYHYTFSGSAVFKNNISINESVTSSYFTGSFIGDGSGLYNLPVQTTDVSMFLSSSAFETFTSSYITESSSFDSRILAATNEQDLSNLATTGSNTFIGDQVITGLVNIDGSLRTNDYKISLGSNTQVGGYAVAIGANTQAASYSVSIGAFAAKKNVTNSTSYTVAIGAFSQQNANDGDQTGTGAIAIGVLAGDSNQGTNAVALGRYAGRDNQAARSIVINATGGDLNNTTSDSLVIKPIRNNDGPSILMYDSVSGEITHTLNNTLATTGSNTFIGDQVVSGSLDISGSATLNNNNIVSSNTIEKIETITSASYASITPVSGTLYIIIG